MNLELFISLIKLSYTYINQEQDTIDILLRAVNEAKCS